MTGKKRRIKKIDVGELFPDDHEVEDREQDYIKEMEEIGEDNEK